MSPIPPCHASYACSREAWGSRCSPEPADVWCCPPRAASSSPSHATWPRRAQAAAEAAATLAAGRLQHIRIAAPGTTLTDILAPFLATLRPDDPLPAVSAQRP